MLLAFEGPDRYSAVGGLGTRVTELSGALAEAGIATTLIFVGDPKLSPEERGGPNLEYRRYCQDVSARHAGGVYDGEREKIKAYAARVPALVESIAETAVRAGRRVLVLAEDWHTEPALIEIDRRLRDRSVRGGVTFVWNANSVYGFAGLDWKALKRAATITAVSRYMKFEVALHGAEALVIPNGIPSRATAGPEAELEAAARKALVRRPLFVKVGRFELEKGWLAAIEAFAAIRASRPDALLILRGGRGDCEAQIFRHMRACGLDVERVENALANPLDALAAIAAVRAPVADVRTFIPEPLLAALYLVADAVLANSSFEPFGLVGLEVMAAGGVAVTGSTGEEYARPFENALVCDTGDPRELHALVETVLTDAALATSIRAAARATAKRYAWPAIIDLMMRKLEFTTQR